MAFWNRIFGWLRRKPKPGGPGRPDRAELLERRRARQEAIEAQAQEASAPAAQADSSFPVFRSSAVERGIARGENSRLMKARVTLRDVFTPAQPVTERSKFAGRLSVLARLIEILEDQRSHVVIYGERGIGKTSLVHILSDIARESRYVVVYASCGAFSTFEDIFRAVLRDIPQLYLRDIDLTALGEQQGSLSDRLSDGFDARQLGELLAQVTGTRVIIVLDEYDRAESDQFRLSVAELIKNLSDRASRVQLVLAGVASNLQQLIGYIPSIRRNIIGLPMPRLSSEEVRALIRIGEKSAGVDFDEDAVKSIESLSNGSPYLVRLVSHHSSMIALDDERMSIQLRDVHTALNKVVEEAASRIDPRLVAAVEPYLQRVDRTMIHAAARAASTPDGWFTPDDAVSLCENCPPEKMLKELNELTLAGVIERAAEGEGARYRFREEPLPTYLWMRVARDDAERGALSPPTRSVAS